MEVTWIPAPSGEPAGLLSGGAHASGDVARAATLGPTVPLTEEAR